ncbi:MAG TPA: chemotaxis protein CheW [Gemmatimonadaceae bacterium]|nr:chemotaxis protein CheW [Gemmatimonadaceae bacterium]
MTRAQVRRLTLALPSAMSELPLRDRLHLDDQINFLIVRIGTERFAFDMTRVVEVVDATSLDLVPQLGDATLGLVTWRGKAHAVWSTGGTLRASVEKIDTAVFLRDDPPVAFAVDDVEDIVTVPGTSVRALNGVDDGAGLVLGALHVDDSLATVVDPIVLAAALRGRDEVVAS